MKRCIFYCEEYQFLNHYAYGLELGHHVARVSGDKCLYFSNSVHLSHCSKGPCMQLLYILGSVPEDDLSLL